VYTHEFPVFFDSWMATENFSGTYGADLGTARHHPLIDGAQAHDAAKSSPSLSTKSVKTRVV